jgi:hypothetical protein
MPEESLLWSYSGRTIVIVHPERPPSDVRWDAMLEESLARPEIDRVLVYSAGGAPNSKQSVRLTDALRQRDARVSVLTASTKVRVATLALRLFRPEIHFFRPTELKPAFDHLGATPEERAELVRVLEELKGQLGLA